MTTATIDTTVEILDMTPVRNLVAVEINSLLDTIGDSYMRVGALLNEARADFENQKEFLEWVDESFGIKKSATYNLMNVARNFSERKEFHGVSQRIMLMLIPFADDGELMDKAAALAAAGDLTVPACNQLLGKPAKGAVSPAAQAVKQAMAAQAQVNSPAPAPEAPTMTYVVPELPDAEDENPWEDVKPEVAEVKSTLPDAISAGILDELKRLREDNQALQARITELTAVRESRKASAPMLPQFKSKCLYARLGLSVEQSMSLAAVNKAKRELVKLGYGEGHDAWPLIQEAVESLGK